MIDLKNDPAVDKYRKAAAQRAEADDQKTLVRISELLAQISAPDLGDLATEAKWNPSDRSDQMAIFSIFLMANVNEKGEWILPDAAEVIANSVPCESTYGDFFNAALFVAQQQIQDAAVQFISRKFGDEAANELECILDDREEVARLAHEFEQVECARSP